MKQFIRRLLVRAARRLPRPLRYIGYEIGAPLLEGAILDTRCIPSMRWSLANMARLGFRPNRILDVGAYVGGWTGIAHQVFPGAAIHMIEAQAGKEPELAEVARTTGSTYSIRLLGPQTGESVIFYEMESGSSILPELSSCPRTERTLTTATLDEVVQELAWDRVDMIKMDVQGYELEVLAGGREALRDCEAVLLEVSVLPVNEGAPHLIGDVLSFMRDRGFVFYDLCTLFRRPLDAALVQLDVVFVRADSPLVREPGMDKPAVIGNHAEIREMAVAAQPRSVGRIPIVPEAAEKALYGQ